MVKLCFILTALLTTSILASCTPSIKPALFKCERSNSTTVTMIGSVDEALLNCAKQNINDEVHTVIVSSFGGHTNIGRAIGRIIGSRPRTVIIEGKCLSSCGNYFIPAASKVVLKPGAFIGLHGTMDPYTIKKHGSNEAEFKDEFADEAKFAAEFGIARGWRIYRDKNYVGGVITKDMAGKLRSRTHKKNDNGFLLIESPFIQTCLPHVDVVGLNIDELFENAEAMKLVNTFGGIGTGSLTCKPDTGQNAEIMSNSLSITKENFQ